MPRGPAAARCLLGNVVSPPRFSPRYRAGALRSAAAARVPLSLCGARSPRSVRGGRGRLGAAGGSLRARRLPAAWSGGGRAADRAPAAPLTRKCNWARPPGSQPITSRGGHHVWLVALYNRACWQRPVPPCWLRAQRPECPARRVGAGRMRRA